MGNIHLLPDSVVNQIAAGEVVERPAAVVKELLENALDAGADQLQVTLHDGGKELISVLDNGHGMDRADALLACQRHATSKIGSEADLAQIRTLGFRGEALASIAAVSRFELITCCDERAGGTRVAAEGGGPPTTGRVGFPRGTKISVGQLFYNTPARRKFLRTTATEFQHAQAAVVNLALAHPEVHFRLIHNQRTVQNLPRCGSLAERVHQQFGRELAEGLIPVEGEQGTVRFSGLVSLPSQARASRRWQYLYINGRLVRHAGLNHAVYQAFRTLLMKDRHPAYVLHLSLDPAEVDVNVHPAKTEVRLRNAQAVHTILADKLYRGVMAASRRIAFAREADPAGRRSGAGLPGKVGGEVRRAVQADGVAGAGGLGDGRQLSLGGEWVREAAPAILANPEGLSGPPPGGAPPVPGARSFPEAPAPDGPPGLAANPLAGSDFSFQPLGEVAPLEGALGPGLAVLAQLGGVYLLVAKGDSLMIVDQHAAHERILFEQCRNQFYRGHLATERYLVPETLELSTQNGIIVEQYLPQWRRMGFDIEPFGKATYLIREAPAILSGRDVKGLILEVLDELALFGKSGRLEEVFNEIMERVACHGAVRGGQSLSVEEMEALVAQLAGLDINLYCPHGRPVWIEISPRELEKRFKRTV